MLKDPPAAVAARLTASPIKEQWLAAIVDWAHVSLRVGNIVVPLQLWEIGRKAAPDPQWVDRLGEIGLQKDRDGLGKRVKDAASSLLSRRLLAVIGDEHWCA